MYVLVCAALGFTGAVHGQQRSAPDSILKARADSIARADSTVGALPQAEVPFLTEVGMSYRWDRDSLFSSGALTLADFLDRVPGLATLRARFYMAPQVGAYNGDVARVRLFLDGVELESLDARTGGIPDLSQFPVAMLEQLVIERGASELRLLMRSWRGPQRVTAQTRADVYTGDNRSNTFRGFLARRAQNGFAVQAMLQRRSTDDRQLGGDGDATTVFARVGLVRARWSIDGTLLRVNTAQQRLSLLNLPSYQLSGRPLPELEQVQREAYLRLGVGDVSRGPWLQLVAASRQNAERTASRPADLANGFRADTTDTTTTSAQYVATAGWSSSRARVSLTERVRMIKGRTLQQPSARVGFDLGRLTASAYAERNPFDEVTRGDVLARLQPTRWLAFTGAVSYGTAGTLSLPIDSTGALAAVEVPVAKAARAELSVRLGRLWLTGGGVLRDSTVLRAPRIFDRTTPFIDDARALGVTFAIAGPLVRGFHLNVRGVRWEDAGWYRPQSLVRSELTWRYDWKGRSKDGGFRFVLSGDAEYRTISFVPYYLQNGEPGALPTVAGTPLGLRAEFTIRDATISAQVRNLANFPYTTVPGLAMNGPLTIYGVRWTFWN